MSRIINDRQIADLTHFIIHSFYTGASALVLEYLHQDIVWINNLTSQCLYGYYHVSSGLFKTPVFPCCHILYGHCHLMFLSPAVMVVSCEYTVFCRPRDGSPSGTRCCSSFIWNLEERQPRLIYVHMSPAVSGQKPAGPLSIEGRHAEIYQVNPEEIMYIEASNIHCSVTLRSHTLEVNQSISRLETLLPPYFMRTHRSFIVNKQYVRKLYRYGMELSSGIQLPVPEKKYMRVVCWIET